MKNYQALLNARLWWQQDNHEVWFIKFRVIACSIVDGSTIVEAEHSLPLLEQEADEKIINIWELAD